MKRNYSGLVLSAVAILIMATGLHAQTTYFDTNGQIIGAVTGDARIGYNTLAKITVTANGGTNITGDAFTHNNSVLNITGGVIGGKLTTEQNSIVNFTGGTVTTDLFAYNASKVNFSGGHVGVSIVADDNSVVIYSGGTLGGILYVEDSALLILVGQLQANPFMDDGAYTHYSLQGVLQDGTSVDGQFMYIQDGGTASYRITDSVAPDVPESGAIPFAALTGGALLGLLARKRRHKRVPTPKGF